MAPRHRLTRARILVIAVVTAVVGTAWARPPHSAREAGIDLAITAAFSVLDFLVACAIVAISESKQRPR